MSWQVRLVRHEEDQTSSRFPFVSFVPYVLIDGVPVGLLAGCSIEFDQKTMLPVLTIKRMMTDGDVKVVSPAELEAEFPAAKGMTEWMKTEEKKL